MFFCEINVCFATIKLFCFEDTDAEAQTTKVIQYVDSDNFSQLSDDGDSQVGEVLASLFVVVLNTDQR